jgi:PhnB protein
MLDRIDELKNFKDKVGHVQLRIGESSIFLSDIIDENTCICNQVHFVIETSSIKELKMVFQKLSLNGTILHEIKELFWCQLSGFVKDQYGVSWSQYHGPK